MTNFPSRESLVQPLLDVLHEHGPMSPHQATNAVADRLQLPSAIRDQQIILKDRERTYAQNALRYQLRWVRQKLASEDVLDGSLRGLWTFTTKGREFYVRAQPGVVISVFSTDLGNALCGEIQSVMQIVEDRSLQTYITSPVYPVLSHRKYGGMTPTECVSFLVGTFSALRPKLTDDANVFLNLGYVFNPGGTQSTYVERVIIELERLGYHLLQRLFWADPTKPPASMSVTHRRTHLVEKVEPIYRIALSPRARGDTRKLLRPYSPSMLRCTRGDGDRYGQRPSRHGHNGRSFAADNGGAIPGNLFQIPHASSNAPAYQTLRARNLPPHPAPMPEALVEPMILLTTSEGDLVGDFMGGGGTVARVAERLNRSWVYGDVHLNYAAVTSAHFEGRPGFTRQVDPVALQNSFRTE